MQITFHGLLPRSKVHELFVRSHALILPSKSEGFPKVISEAMNYGCIPIVSNVSSIGHYVKNGKNGLLIEPLSPFGLVEQLQRFFSITPNELCSMMENVDFLQKFSYSYYNKRVKEEIL